jgi:hypothetical protein
MDEQAAALVVVGASAGGVEAVTSLAAVARLSEEPLMSDNADEDMRLETEYATPDARALAQDGPSDTPSPYACPAAYSADGTVEAQGESVVTALWTALRPLRERAQLCERLAERIGSAGAARSSERFALEAEEASEQAETIRRLLAGSDGPGG